MSFLKTLCIVKGRTFEYSHELRAKAIGMPLLEKHCLRSGKVEIDVQSKHQLEDFLQSNDIQHLRIPLNSDLLIVLIGEKRRTVVFQFDGVNNLTVRRLALGTLKKALRENISVEKARLTERYKKQIAEKDSVFTQIAELAVV